MGWFMLRRLQRGVLCHRFSVAVSGQGDESKGSSHYLVALWWTWSHFSFVHNQQMDVVWKHGGRRYSLGVDLVDAVRDVVHCGAAFANGGLHGRIQSVYRD